MEENGEVEENEMESNGSSSLRSAELFKGSKDDEYENPLEPNVCEKIYEIDLQIR